MSDHSDEELDGGVVAPSPHDLFGDMFWPICSKWLPPRCAANSSVVCTKRAANEAVPCTSGSGPGLTAKTAQPPHTCFVKAVTPGSTPFGNMSPSEVLPGACLADGTGKGASKVMRMMQAMGYTEGTGLGRAEQGISSAPEEQGNIGTLGLGFRGPGFGGGADGAAPLKAAPLGAAELDPCPVPLWMGPCERGVLDGPTLSAWVVEGPRLESVDGETEHINPAVLGSVLHAKSGLDHITDRRAFNDARTRANPFEGLKKEFFLNRAALKMAAMDAAFGMLFSGADAGVRFTPTRSPSP